MRGTTRARCITGRRAPCVVRRLDWHHPDASLVESRNPSDPFGWSAAELAELSRCTLVLCADCIYDAAATDALLALLAPLLAALPPTAAALFAIERRLNFDAGGLIDARPRRGASSSWLGEDGRFEGGASPNLAQRFEYVRVKESGLARLAVAGRRRGAARGDRSRAGHRQRWWRRRRRRRWRRRRREGLTLARSEKSVSGFMHVHACGSVSNPWQAEITRGDQRNYLGHLLTAEKEAALAVARFRADHEL